MTIKKHLLRGLWLALTTLATISHLSASNVLFFNQDCNFDLAGADNTCSDERFNLLNIIQADGHSVTLLDSFNQDNLLDLLNQNDFLAIPDIEDSFENCNVTDLSFLSSGSRSILKAYIDGGGSILIAGSVQNIELLNSVFQLNIVSAGTIATGFSIKKTIETESTPFQNCVDSIPNADATFLLNSSMPDNKKCIYGTGGSASVAFFTVGQGSITYLGYDFNDAGPGCSQALAVWNSCVTESAIIAADSGIAVTTIPTISEWGLIILALLLMVIGILTAKNITIYEATTH